MIGIEVNGEFLDLFPDTRINLKLINPIFADGNVIPGSYSIPFNVPGGDASKKNSRLLLHPDVVENPLANPTLDARLFYDGVFYKKGKLRIDKAGGSISLNFKFGLTTISEDFKKLKLRDLLDEAVDMVPGHTYTKKVLVAARTTTYGGTFRINVNGTEYSGTTNAAIATAINADTDEPRARATYVASVIDAGAADHFTIENYDNPNDVLAPLEVDLPDDESFTRWFVQVDAFESAYNNPIQTWLNAYHTATPADSKLRFGLVKNISLFKDEKTEFGRSSFISFFSPFVNLADATNFFLNTPVSNNFFTPRNYTSVVPFVTVSHILNKIKTLIADIEGDYNVADGAVIVHSNSLDMPIQFVGTSKWLATRTTFNVNEFVPDISVVDFLKALQTRFNFAIYFNERTNKIRIQPRDTILTGNDYLNITSICSKQDSVGYEQNPTGIRLVADQDDLDLLAQGDNYEVGDPDLTINTPISGFQHEEQHNPIIFRRWLIGSLTNKKFESIVTDRPYDTKIPFTFGFYDYRASLDASAINYPTIVKNSPDGPFTFTQLVADRWTEYLRFLINRKIVTLDAMFEMRHLLDIDWEKKYQFDRVNYLISSLDITLTMRGIEPTRAELYTTGLGVLP